VIAYREAFEAVLILVPMLAYVITKNKSFLAKYIYSGAFTGLIVSVIGGAAVFSFAKTLGGTTEQYFQGSMMLFVAGLILYIVVWMQGSKKSNTENQEHTILLNTNRYPLFIISFLTVFKEGLEVVVFTFTSISLQATSIALGTGVGVLLAVLTAFILYKTTVKLNIALIFKLMSIVLLFIGAEMFGEALIAFAPTGGTSLQNAAFLTYLIPTLYFFLRSSAKEFLLKFKN
jgi:high-affinity iron transporter